MATFRKESNGYIYLYHWIDPSTPLKVSTKLKIGPNGGDSSRIGSSSYLGKFNQHSFVNKYLNISHISSWFS